MTDAGGSARRDCSVDEAIEFLLDVDTAAAIDLPITRPCGGLRLARAAVLGRTVFVAAMAQDAKRGAIGVIEARALTALFDALPAPGMPLVFVLDSSGARMDLGLEMLVAFRELLTAVLRARQRGVRSVALVRSICFGGASMLAYFAQRRIFTHASRIAMSGPAVIASVAGKDELDPNDKIAVDALMGGAARAALNDTDRLCADDPDALRGVLAACLDELQGAPDFSIADRHRALLARLTRHGIDMPRNPRPSPPALKQRMDALLPQGFETVLGAGVVRGVRLFGTREVTITGIVGGAPITAVASWMLAESIITSVRARPDRPIVILYDAPGHAMTRADEAVALSDYYVHLAQTVQWATDQGIAVSVWILGEASGGGYVALTAGCRSVLALQGADVRVLPRDAVASIVQRTPEEESGVARWLALGLIDHALPADFLSPEAARVTGLAS